MRSYFAETSVPRPPKLRRLLAEIQRMEHQQCGSELEALLLERRLIAELQPVLNRQHKRFAVYPYLLLSDEKFPRLTVTRAEPVEEKDEDGRMKDKEVHSEFDEASEYPDSVAAEISSFILHPSSLPLETPPRAGSLPGLYLGPFTSPRAAMWTMEAVRVLFPLRSCEGDIVPDANGRGCFYHEIGRCCGPCVGTTPQDEYSKLCESLINLLHTGQAPQIEQLRARMNKLAEEWRFEEAAKLREQLRGIEVVTARLQRLERMRRENNAAIVQPSLPDENGKCGAAVFLVRGGMVRRHLVIHDWSDERPVKKALRETFDGGEASAPFTGKSELDEMMILDRWLRSHGEENCCIWLNDENRLARQWTSNAFRRLRRWALVNL